MLNVYYRNNQVRPLLMARLAPDQWHHGQHTGRQAPPVIALREYAAGRVDFEPAKKQAKLEDYGFVLVPRVRELSRPGCSSTEGMQ